MYTTLVTSVLTPSDYPSAQHLDLYKETVCKLINAKLQCLNLWSITNKATTIPKHFLSRYINLY